MKQIDHYFQSFGDPEKRECPNCGEINEIFYTDIKGRKVPYCEDCEHELKKIK